MTTYGTDVLTRAGWRKLSAMVRQLQHLPRYEAPRATARSIEHGGTAWTVAAVGREPIAVYPSHVVDQPAGRRRAIELDWAARYRREARQHGRHRPSEYGRAIAAARACLADAAGIGSAFAALP